LDNYFNSNSSNSSKPRTRRNPPFRLAHFLALLLPATLLFFTCAELIADPPAPRPYHVTHYDAAIQPSFGKPLIFGAVTISLVALSEHLTQVELDAADITVVGCSQGKIHLKYLLAGSVLRVDLLQPLHAGERADLRIAYRATPTRGAAFFPDLVFTAFATSHWLPCNDRPDDRATFRLVVVTPERFRVVASGDEVHESVRDGQRTTEWRQNQPIPTFVFGFAAGLFQYQSRREGKTRLWLAVLAPPSPAPASAPPQAQAKPPADASSHPPAAESLPAAEPQAADSSPPYAAVLDDTASALAFFEGLAGVPYSASAYTTVFAHGQVMQEAAGFTLLPEAYLASLKKDPGDLWLLAHELAHQWWGIGLTARDWSDFWLNEGVATFVADAFLEKRFGKQRYETELERSRKIYTDILAANDGRPLHFTAWTIPSEAGGPIPYHKGALFLDALRSQLGDSTFWPAFRSFTRAYIGQSVTSEIFEKSMENSCHCDLRSIFGVWVY
jgi:aminopeptidase N